MQVQALRQAPVNASRHSSGTHSYIRHARHPLPLPDGDAIAVKLVHRPASRFLRERQDLWVLLNQGDRLVWALAKDVLTHRDANFWVYCQEF